MPRDWLGGYATKDGLVPRFAERIASGIIPIMNRPAFCTALVGVAAWLAGCTIFVRQQFGGTGGGYGTGFGGGGFGGAGSGAPTGNMSGMSSNRGFGQRSIGNGSGLSAGSNGFGASNNGFGNGRGSGFGNLGSVGNSGGNLQTSSFVGGLAPGNFIGALQQSLTGGNQGQFGSGT